MVVEVGGGYSSRVLPPVFTACAYNLPPEVPDVENDELAEEAINGLFENSFPDDLNNGPDWIRNGDGLDACVTEEKGFPLSCCGASLGVAVASWKGFLALTFALNFPP